MRYIASIIVALLLGNIGLSLWNAHLTPKVAYVRSQDLVYGYFGMKEAMESFRTDQQQWKGNLDTLSADLQRSIAQARQLHVAGNTTELARLEPVIQQQQQDLMRYKDAMEKKASEDEQKILSGVLGQVNAFVEKYAEERGYDVVLGTTDSGSLLYGEGGLDITEELLAALNKDHEGDLP